MVQTLFDRIVPRIAAEERQRTRHCRQVLDELGFDRIQHEQIRADLRAGRIGLAQNRLPASTDIRDVEPADVTRLEALKRRRRSSRLGMQALRARRGGRGDARRRCRQPLDAGRRASSRRCNPFCQARRAPPHLSRSAPGQEPPHRPGLPARLLPHVVHHQLSDPRADRRVSCCARATTAIAGPLLLSPGRAVGLRLVPMVRDLRFAWEEMPQQLLDEQAQKVRESLHAALIGWAQCCRRRERLHRQPAAAVPASGRALV